MLTRVKGKWRIIFPSTVMICRLGRARREQLLQAAINHGFGGGRPPSAVIHGVEPGLGLSAFATWERSAAPTSKNASESKTMSLVERINPPQNLWDLGTRTRDAGKFTSEMRVSVKVKKR